MTLGTDVVATPSERAIRDTIAAVLRDRAFTNRSVLPAWVERSLGWIVERLARFGDTRHDSPLVFWTGIAVALVIVLAVGLRVAMIAAARRERVALAPSLRGSAAAARDPLADARELAAAGDFLGAAHALYGAALQAIARIDRVRLHESRTAGDYRRELARRGSPRRDAFVSFVRAYERAVFGREPCDASRFADLTRLSTPITGPLGIVESAVHE